MVFPLNSLPPLHSQSAYALVREVQGQCLGTHERPVVALTGALADVTFGGLHAFRQVGTMLGCQGRPGAALARDLADRSAVMVHAGGDGFEVRRVAAVAADTATVPDVVDLDLVAGRQGDAVMQLVRHAVRGRHPRAPELAVALLGVRARPGPAFAGAADVHASPERLFEVGDPQTLLAVTGRACTITHVAPSGEVWPCPRPMSSRCGDAYMIIVSQVSAGESAA